MSTTAGATAAELDPRNRRSLSPINSRKRLRSLRSFGECGGALAEKPIVRTRAMSRLRRTVAPTAADPQSECASAFDERYDGFEDDAADDASRQKLDRRRASKPWYLVDPRRSKWMRRPQQHVFLGAAASDWSAERHTHRHTGSLTIITRESYLRLSAGVFTEFQQLPVAHLHSLSGSAHTLSHVS